MVAKRVEPMLGEPVFTIRAKDAIAVRAVLRYATYARDAGCTDDFITEVHMRASEMDVWQRTHPELVKLPD